MMNKESLEKMSRMRLLGMHQAFKACIESEKTETFTNDEMVHHLVQSEWDDRQHRSLQRGLKNANFRYSASIEQLDYTEKSGDWIKTRYNGYPPVILLKKGEDLFITGSTGTGKSFLASALGQQACLMSYKVLYTNTAKLMSHLKTAKVDGAHLKELSKIEKQDALILDDFGVQPFDTQSRALLLDIIKDRHGKRSTIITAQTAYSH